MKELLIVFAVLAVIVAGISLGIWIDINRFRDCVTLGHGGIYCVATWGVK